MASDDDWKTCGTCEGSGVVPDRLKHCDKECRTCNGNGQVRR